MNEISITLNVFFEDPFWIGILERTEGNTLCSCKITFGAEPKDYEVYSFILQNWYKLQFSLPIDNDLKVKSKINPKRLQRELKKQLNNIGIGTKSQQALKLQHDENKLAKKTKTREERELEKERLYAIKTQKKKDKHKGH